MTKIIGHRGAAGLALENTHESLAYALEHGADAIEFDVHLTRDGHLVVIHDEHTGRIATETVTVREQTLAELRRIKLLNKQRIPTLEAFLKAAGNSPVIIEIKAEHCVEPLLKTLRRFPKLQVSVASFLHDELARLHKQNPTMPIYLLEHYSPVQVIANARALHAQGIGLNKWLMNPLTYFLARRYGLELYVYTLNSVWLVRFFKLLYPKVVICTDHPERFTRKRRRRQ